MNLAMKKLLFSLVLILSTQSAFAEGINFGSNPKFLNVECIKESYPTLTKHFLRGVFAYETPINTLTYRLFTVQLSPGANNGGIFDEKPDPEYRKENNLDPIAGSTDNFTVRLYFELDSNASSIKVESFYGNQKLEDQSSAVACN